jgi:hypothetical protein
VNDPIRAAHARRFPGIYLIVGALLLVVSAIRPGRYGGFVNGNLTIDAPGFIRSVSIEAQTPPSWRWIPPRNHKYQKATMTISSPDVEKAVVINLVDGTWRRDGDAGVLDSDSILRLITFGNDTELSSMPLEAQVQGLLDQLQQLRSGTFLPARHHTHQMDKPFLAYYQHFTIGWNVGPYGIFVWLMVWPVWLLLERPKTPGRWLTPLRAFTLTLAIVAGLDLLFGGIAIAFSPGAVSEMMEMLVGVVNLPAAIVLGDREASSWIGLAFGALSWSVIVSMIVIFRNSREQKPAGAAEDPTDGHTGHAHNP